MVSVFVGNIPFDATEEELLAHFSQVGPVVAFRAVTDRETGRPKGYGFCEYRNAETALSAARNLNDLELNGRALRVSLTDGVAQQAARGDRDPAEAAQNEALMQTQIASVVLAMSPEQLADLLMSARSYVGKEPHHAHELLSKSPPLAHALVQALNRVNMILSLQAQTPVNGAPTAGQLQFGAQGNLQPRRGGADDDPYL